MGKPLSLNWRFVSFQCAQARCIVSRPISSHPGLTRAIEYAPEPGPPDGHFAGDQGRDRKRGARRSVGPLAPCARAPQPSVSRSRQGRGGDCLHFLKGAPGGAPGALAPSGRACGLAAGPARAPAPAARVDPERATGTPAGPAPSPGVEAFGLGADGLRVLSHLPGRVPYAGHAQGGQSARNTGRPRAARFAGRA